MAQITLNYPDGQGKRIVDAFKGEYNYKDQIEDPENPGEMIPNPESGAAFTKRMVLEFVKGVVIGHERKEAARLAQEQADQATPPDIT